jgi:hypothetical protein
MKAGKLLTLTGSLETATASTAISIVFGSILSQEAIPKLFNCTDERIDE